MRTVEEEVLFKKVCCSGRCALREAMLFRSCDHLSRCSSKAAESESGESSPRVGSEPDSSTAAGEDM